jgi:hypothetical protein
MATAAWSSRSVSVRVVATRPRQARQGPSSAPPLKSIPQQTTSRAATSSPTTTFNRMDLPDPVAPTIRVCWWTSDTATGSPVSQTPGWSGRRIDLAWGPAQGMEAACGSRAPRLGVAPGGRG